MRRLSSDRGHRKGGDVSPADSNLSADSKNALDRKQMTLEERKVAYEEARARIFQDFGSNSGEGSEVEVGSQPSSSTGSPAIKAAVEKKGSGTSTPDESSDEPAAGMTRNLSNRGKQFTPRTQTNIKRPPPREKENITEATHSYPRLDHRFTAQAPPFLPSQPSPYQTSPYGSQQQQSPAYNNSRNNSSFGYPTPYSNTPLYDPYNANLVQPNNPNFANYWKPQQRPPSANSTSISPSMSAAGPSSQQHPSQPLSRVWNPNTNTSAEPWGLQDFTPSTYADNMRMRPSRPPPGHSNGQLYNPNPSQDMQFQDQRPVQGSYNGQMNNSNVPTQGMWSTRPDNRDWGPLW